MAAAARVPRYVVLAAVDDGPLADEVLRAGAELARGAPGGELHLIHAVELPPPSAVPAPPGLGVTPAEIEAVARERLDGLVAKARGLFGGRIAGHLVAGSASKQILQVAVDLRADVILVGTHGRTGLKRMLLGSVAEAVVRRASCPVLVVRPKDYRAIRGSGRARPSQPSRGSRSSWPR